MANLVLGRKHGERVIVTMPDGRRCTVCVAEIRGDKVRLAFEVDDNVAVNRQEVQDAIDRDAGREPMRFKFQATPLEAIQERNRERRERYMAKVKAGTIDA